MAVHKKTASAEKTPAFTKVSADKEAQGDKKLDQQKPVVVSDTVTETIVIEQAVSQAASSEMPAESPAENPLTDFKEKMAEEESSVTSNSSSAIFSLKSVKGFSAGDSAGISELAACETACSITIVSFTVSETPPGFCWSNFLSPCASLSAETLVKAGVFSALAVFLWTAIFKFPYVYYNNVYRSISQICLNGIIFLCIFVKIMGIGNEGALESYQI